MEGADESTELWWHPLYYCLSTLNLAFWHSLFYCFLSDVVLLTFSKKMKALTFEATNFKLFRILVLLLHMFALQPIMSERLRCFQRICY